MATEMTVKSSEEAEVDSQGAQNEDAPALPPTDLAPAEKGGEDIIEPDLPLSTPSIMSAGADPWADPPMAAKVAEAIATSKRSVTGDNPWASNTPELGIAESSTVAKDEESNSKLNGTVHMQTEERWGEYHLPKLGHSVARYWSFKSDLLQLNNGSYGCCPKPVCEAYKALQDRQEENCDYFRNFLLSDLLAESRSKVAKLLNCSTDNVVLVSNSTTGTNAVLRDLVYKDNDAVLVFSTTYGAVQKTLNWLIDTEAMRGVRLHRVQVDFDMPMKKQEIIKILKKSIADAEIQGLNIRIGIVDTISSKPALKLPWEEMVKVLRDAQILSFVDGAHGIGHIDIDLTRVDPDFFISNCHKWLYAHRGCAVLYVAPRNLHLQRSGLPTSHSYMKSPSENKNTWTDQWLDAGTVDVSPLLSVDAAIEFRQMLGGEERIRNYNNDLALRGGKMAAQILDTCILDDEDDSFTCNMVNVELPIIKSRTGNNVQKWQSNASSWFASTLLTEFKLVAPTFTYRDKIWVRMSAQVWLEVSDFEYAARAFLELCNRINQGIAPDFAKTTTKS